MIQLSDKVFYTVWGEALKSGDRDIYVSEWSTSSIWGEPETLTDEDLLEIAQQLGKIWDVAHMSVKDFCKAAGMSQTAFATRFCIPKRTIEDWCTAKRTPPDYVRLMLAEILGIIKR